MNLKETLSRLEMEYGEKVERAKVAAKIARKIDGLLPEGWKSEYDDFITLEITKHNPAPIEEMMLVRKLVSKATGKKVVLIPSSSGKKLYGIYGSVDYDYGTGDLHKYLWVKICAYKPECKVEFVSKGSTMVEQFEAVVDEACLGMHEEKEG
jgi:hypothetical protein